MDSHFDVSLVQGFEHRMDALQLPDPNDRHVVAAALDCGADAIVTFNLRDFPPSVLQPLGLEALHPDSLISELLLQDEAACLRAIRKQRLALRHPARSADELLETFAVQGLPRTVAVLREKRDLF